MAVLLESSGRPLKHDPLGLGRLELRSVNLEQLDSSFDFAFVGAVLLADVDFRILLAIEAGYQKLRHRL